jgi:hypothetical protein
MISKAVLGRKGWVRLVASLKGEVVGFSRLITLDWSLVLKKLEGTNCLEKSDPSICTIRRYRDRAKVRPSSLRLYFSVDEGGLRAGCASA